MPSFDGNWDHPKDLYDWLKDKVGGKSSSEQQNDENRRLLNEQVGKASGFADQGQAGFGRTGLEAERARQYLRDVAEGRNSVSARQLQQGLQQNLAAQRSMAASAAPANAAMAARTAAQQGARLGYGLAGQQAIAGLQERQQAQQALNQAILGARGQDLNAALGSRDTAVRGLAPQVQPEKSFWEKYGPAAETAGTLFSIFSDKRLKRDIEDADDESRKVVDGLKAYTFKYKDEKHGKGKQFGIMAQDLERSGLGHAVIETRVGKAVDGGRLATANTALIASLGKRIAKLEERDK